MALVADLGDKDVSKQYAALDALVKAGPKAKAAVPALVKQLEIDAARRHAVGVLGAIGPDAKDAVPALLAVLPKDKESGYAVDAIAVALMQIDGPKPEATRALLLSSGKCTPIYLVSSQTLRERPAVVVPHVVALSTDPDAQVRVKAATVLGGLKSDLRKVGGTILDRAGDGAKGIPAALEKLLADDDVDVRLTAALAIAHVAPQLAAKSVPVFVAAATSADEKVAEKAHNRLAVEAFRPVPNAAAKALIPLFDHTTDRVRWWAINTLSELPVSAALEAALKNGTTARAREAAAITLGSRYSGGQPSAAALTAALSDPEFAVRFAAAVALVRVVENGTAAQAPAVPVLVEGLGHADVQVRTDATHNLVRIGAPAKAAIPALKKMLADKTAEVRLDAALALVAIDPAGAAGAVPVFVAALKAKDEAAATQAAQALPKLGATAKDAVPELVKHFGAKNVHLRLFAAGAAARIDPAQAPKATEVLVAVLKSQKDKATMIRSYALAAVTQIGPPAKAAIPALAELLVDDGPFHGDVALAMIVVDAGNAAVAYDWMRKALAANDSDDEFIERLPELGALAKPLVPALAGRLKSGSAYDRRSAAEALGAVGPGAKDALPELKKIAESDKRAEVRAAAADAVKKIEGK